MTLSLEEDVTSFPRIICGEFERNLIEENLRQRKEGS